MRCPSCEGGTWYSECCDGSGGCTCRGRVVAMGPCRVCRGTGEVEEGAHDPLANFNALMATGACFLGSGPLDGSWAGAPRLGMTWP